MEENGQRGEAPFTVLKEAGISYSLCAILPSLVMLLVSLILGAVGAAEGDIGKYASFLVPQVCFAAVAVLFFRRSNVPPRESYAPCKWYYFPLALGMQFGLLFCLGELNGLFIDGLTALGYKPALDADTLPSLDGWDLLPALLVIAVLPALFEETVFRGITVGSMRRSGWGDAFTVLLSGALFSLFHHNPEQTVYQFLNGAAYALLAIRAGSILPTMLAHFSNNAAILCLQSFGALDGAGEFTLPQGGYIALVCTAGGCLVLSMVLLLLLGRGKGKNAVEKNGPKRLAGGKTYFLFAAVGIGLCAVEWIVLLISRCL